MGSDAPETRVGPPLVCPRRDLHRSPRKAQPPPPALDAALPKRTTHHTEERRRGAVAVPPRAQAAPANLAPEPPDGARREIGRGPVGRAGFLPKPLRPAPNPVIHLGGSAGRAHRRARRGFEPHAESIVDGRARESHDPPVGRRSPRIGGAGRSSSERVRSPTPFAAGRQLDTTSVPPRPGIAYEVETCCEPPSRGAVCEWRVANRPTAPVANVPR